MSTENGPRGGWGRRRAFVIGGAVAAGLLVAKGGTRGSAEKAVLGQLGSYPMALFVASALMLILGVMPGLPFIPFAMLAGLMTLLWLCRLVSRRQALAVVVPAVIVLVLTHTRTALLAMIVGLLVAGVAAGLVGSAGGITSLISYPVLLAVGLPAHTANIANNVALAACWPGSALGSRPELRGTGP